MRARWVPAVASLLVAAACSSGAHPSPTGSDGTPTTAGASSAPAGEFTLPPSTSGAESAAAVRTRLCVRPPAPAPSPAPVASVPAAVTEVEHQVEQVRGLNYEHPVAVDAVTHDQLVHGLNASFDHSYPKEMLDRRSLAWSTIGVIPHGSSLRDAWQSFLSSQVIGYYDPSTGQLVFIGSDNPTPYARFILAHELTHADDDQHFDLARLNDLENTCDDEGLTAATGAVEGSAVFYSQEVVSQFFTDRERQQLISESSGGGLPSGVPPFVEQLATWPYIDGPAFIQAIEASGGQSEVDAAIRDLPPSTEQIMHPDRFPADRPVAVDVPDLGPTLGSGWRDLDVMDTGEEWLRTALGLDLSGSQAAAAAEGWGGAQYRAWTDGTHVAVVLDTTWDTTDDAKEFLDAMGSWIAGRDDAAVGTASGDDTGVVALFASDSQTLQRLEAAVR